MTSWQTQHESLSPTVTRTTISAGQEVLSYATVINLWQHDESFRELFINILKDSPFAACFWETPPVTLSTIDREFECVLIDSPQLAGITEEPDAFASRFRDAGPDPVTHFPNLGNDAVLVTPCPRNEQTDHSHLAAFTRSAPLPVQHHFWTAIGTVMKQQTRTRRIWLSTSGLGVHWLHARLDTKPKYYQYPAYAAAAS